MKYIDISQTIFTGMKKYPTDPSVKICRVKSLKAGNSCNLNRLILGSHTGTHIDAPCHILEEANTIEDIKIKDLFCDVIVTDIKKLSNKKFFEKIKRRGIKGILLKKEEGRAILNTEEARALVKNRIKLVGTEELSVEESSSKSHPVHRLLLGSGAIVVECLNLKKVKPGYYKLVCLPLKIKSGDAAPARAILADD